MLTDTLAALVLCPDVPMLRRRAALRLLDRLSGDAAFCGPEMWTADAVREFCVIGI